MMNILKQPLFHFLLIGLSFFILFSLVNPEEENVETIVVDKEALLTYLQNRSQVFEREAFEERLNSLSDEDLESLINQYIRDEVLFREATEMELGDDDYIIRRRMIQKMEFISSYEGTDDLSLSERELRSFYEQNKDRYYIKPTVTFTHIFFSSSRRADAKEQATRELTNLNSNRVRFIDASKYGDKFNYMMNYFDQDAEFLGSQFGDQMTEQIFQTEPSPTWVGPLQSPLGYHLLLITHKKAGRMPPFEEVKEMVTEDANRTEADKKVEDMIAKYSIEVAYQQRSKSDAR